MSEAEELKAYYESLSNIQLVELHLGGGFTEVAQTILNHELSKRGMEPEELNEEYLNKLLVESGHPKGIKTFVERHPLLKILDGLRRFKSLATGHPYLFSIIIIAIHPLVYIAFNLVPDSMIGKDHEETRAIAYVRSSISFVIYGAILWKFGWFRATGFLSMGKRRTWILMAIFLAYETVIVSLAAEGSIIPGKIDFYSELPITSWIIYPLIHFLLAALFEETICRGFIFYCFLRIWGNSSRGIFKSVLISSAIFGLLHIYGSISGWEDLLPAAFKVLNTFLSGIVFCAFLLHGRSIWIPVAYHALSNFSLTLYSFEIVHLSALDIGSIFFLIQLPLVLFAIYMISRTETRSIVSDAE